MGKNAWYANSVLKNMSNSTIKGIKDIYDTESPAREQTRKYKRCGKEFIPEEDLALSIIIDCRTPKAIEFRSKLGFNQHNLIMTKE